LILLLAIWLQVYSITDVFGVELKERGVFIKLDTVAYIKFASNIRTLRIIRRERRIYIIESGEYKGTFQLIENYEGDGLLSVFLFHGKTSILLHYGIKRL